MNADPRVSVIIPTFHRPAPLARALDSVLAQTWTDFNVFVVDDGPDDAAESVVRRVDDPRLHYLRHEASRGAGAARNTGLRQATGEFVAFLDDDDTWLPPRLERQLDRFAGRDERLAVVWCSSVKVSDISGRVISENRAGPLLEGHVDFLRSTRFGTSVPLIRRSALVAVGGFDERLPGAQDRDLWIRLALRFGFDFVPDVLVQHHIHGDQITADLGKKVLAREMLLEKHRRAFEAHPDAMARYLLRLGMLCCADERFGKGRRFLRQAIAKRPFTPRPWRDLLRATITPAAYRRYLLERVFAGADGVKFFY